MLYDPRQAHDTPRRTTTREGERFDFSASSDPIEERRDAARTRIKGEFDRALDGYLDTHWGKREAGTTPPAPRVPFPWNGGI